MMKSISGVDDFAAPLSVADNSLESHSQIDVDEVDPSHEDDEADQIEKVPLE